MLRRRRCRAKLSKRALLVPLLHHSRGSIFQLGADLWGLRYASKRAQDALGSLSLSLSLSLRINGQAAMDESRSDFPLPSPAVVGCMFNSMKSAYVCVKWCREIESALLRDICVRCVLIGRLIAFENFN